MEFRPCIDIHNGKVKQIVGGSLKDEGDFAKENFSSEQDASCFALYYDKLGLSGGHVILLNGKDSPYYEATKAQAKSALSATPGKLQVGGGINPSSCTEFLEAGASQVIVTSYVFSGGRVDHRHLEEMVKAAGKEHLVLDLSCRKKDDEYYIVTDRWQKFTEEKLDAAAIRYFSEYASELLIHAVDVEGKASGIEEEVARLMAASPVPVTYAGGVHSLEDIRRLKELGQNRVNVTIGSALSLFGGSLELEDVIAECRKA